jgi:hypothetical protein
MQRRAMLFGALTCGALLAAPAAARSARDLGGLWTNATLTPLERPAGFDGLTTTEAAAASYEARRPQEFLASGSEGVGARESEWWELAARMTRVRGEIRTSIIVDPPDGKLPYSEAGRRLLAAAAAGVLTRYEGPEARPSPERCLMGGGGSSGVPMFAPNYNSNYRFVQTADHLAILSEMGGSARIIPLTKRPHLPSHIRPWMGDSVGRWDGDTLEIETANFNVGETYKIPAPIYISEAARVTERLTRVSAGEILYAFRVDDPKAYTRPWRGEQIFRTSQGPMFENACHEGNYSLPGILSGARQQEAAAGVAR